MRVRGLDLAAYARAFYLLVRHPQIMLAPLFAAVAQVLLFMVIPSGEGFVGTANAGLEGIFAQLISWFGLAVAVIVADAAWRKGRAPFDDAWDQSRHRAGDILMSALGVSFVVYVASAVGSILGEFGTLALSAVATFFLIYSLPAAAIGGTPGIASLQVSIERARANPIPTLLLTILYVFAFTIMQVLLITALTPLFMSNSALSSGPVSSLIVAFIKAPVGGYVALMLAKTYEDVSYGRR